MTPDGGFAAFSSTRPVTGFENREHVELFRYDATADTLDCASCSSTNASPTTETTLSPNGLNLTDDGRLFFTTSEPLAIRDTNEQKDAYEWSDGELQLVSTGISPFDSILLGVSADGVNAFFFTRDTLVPQDRNGTLTKIYNARAGGGFLFIPPPVACKASDECHGAGSETPSPPSINTITGTGGNTASPRRCRKGFVRKRGKCVRRKPNRKRAQKRRGKRVTHTGSARR